MANIKSHTMLGSNHSWAITMRALLKELKVLNNNLYLESINGTQNMDKELLKFVGMWHPNPDLNISYTMPKNFPDRFKTGKKKVAIYNYESSILPPEWVAYQKYVDYIIPSSNWAADIFISNGWDSDKIKVIHHGITEVKSNTIYKLKTKKSFKFLNVSIPHWRKNIHILVNAYYSTFSAEDDVCLVLKTSILEPKAAFECNVIDIIREAQRRFTKNLPEIELISDSIPDMGALYNAVNCIISTSSSEGFGLPLLEGLYYGKSIIAPACSGQLDFLTKDNSYLIDVKEIPADSRYQYWKYSPGAKTYTPELESVKTNMKAVIYNQKNIDYKVEESNILNNFTWKIAAKKIMDLI